MIRAVAGVPGSGRRSVAYMDPDLNRDESIIKKCLKGYKPINHKYPDSCVRLVADLDENRLMIHTRGKLVA